MSSNTVRASVDFSFQGETHALSSVIDLDRCSGEDGAAPNLHLLLARAHGIDPYSYLYEVLESHDLEFAEPTGLAAKCCADGGFDWELFVRLRDDEQDLRVVRRIAAKLLPGTDLDARADLAAALLAAYRAGKTAD